MSNLRIKFTDLKLGPKLGLAFAFVIVLFLIPIVISLVYFNEAAHKFEEINDTSIPEIYLVTSVYTDIKHIEKNLYASTLTNDIAKKEDYIELSNNIHNSIVANLSALSKLRFSNTEKVEELHLLLESEQEVRDKILTSKYKSDAERMIFHSYDPLVIKISKSLDELTSYINLEVNNSATSTHDNSHKAINITIIMAIAVIILSVIITVKITSSIIRPVKEIEKLSNSLSEGNLSVKIDYKSSNELGKLSENIQHSIMILSSYISEIDKIMEEFSKGNFTAKLNTEFKGDFERIEKSINSFAEMISETLYQTNIASSDVLRGSEEISNRSLNLSQGTQEQASTIEELSATIEELSNRVKLNAGISKEANFNFNQMNNEINTSNNYMKDMISAMEEINDKSYRIEKIIKTIEDIASQTNILALNAAIEAARVGSVGKGFAVVADEVRNLANRSSEAAKSTSLLIKDTLNSVSTGDRALNLTAKSLSNVVSSSTLINETINEISDASQEQAMSVEQLLVGIDHISGIVQNNAAIAEEDAAASQELTARVQELNDLINRFEIQESVI